MDKILVTRSSMPSYEEYIDAIKPLWDSHWLTNMGVYHEQLENELKEYLGVPEVSLMVNGHMALEMTIQAFDFPKNSEIITTPFTFISTTHAIARNRLVPVFCDVKESDGTIDEEKIEELITDKTVAILPVHVYGNICNVERIQEIADKHGLKVIYDAAHVFGETYKGVGIGNYGDASVFSFHATKVFNTIEGGAVTFSKHCLYEKLYNLKNFGIRGEEVVEAIGANAKMNEFCAIMGLCNLEHIKEVIENRKSKYEYYINELKQIEGISLFSKMTNQTSNYGYLPVLFENMQQRDECYELLKKKEIYSRKYFYPLTSEQKCYEIAASRSSTPTAKNVSNRVLVLPLYEELEYLDIDRIIGLIRR